MTAMTEEIRRQFGTWFERLHSGDTMEAAAALDGGFIGFCGGEPLNGPAQEVCRSLAAALRDVPYSPPYPIQVDGLDADWALAAVCVREGAAAGLAVSAVCRMHGPGLRIRQLHVTLPPAEEKALRSLTAHVPGGVQRCLDDPYFTLDRVTDSFVALFGYTREDIRERFHNRYIEMIEPEDRPVVLAQTALPGEQTMETEYRVRRKDGRIIWVLDKGRRVRSRSGKSYLYCLLIDHSETHAAQEKLRQSEERYRIILDQTTDILFEWDIRRDTLEYSANWDKKFGYTPINQAISRRLPATQHIHPDDLPAFLAIMHGTAGGEPYMETELRIRRRDGRFLWCRVRATTLYDDDGAPDKVVGVILDIDSEKKLSMRLRERAERDALTRIYNRGATETHIGAYLQKEGKDSRHALLILDIDDFKQVNDRRGHLFGDAVLRELAAGLQQIFRISDVVGRIGGDEFVVLMKDVPDKTIVRQKAKEMLAVFRHLSGEDGGRLSGSIGAALYPSDGTAYHQLFRHADKALYAAKKRGKDAYAFYDETNEG